MNNRKYKTDPEELLTDHVSIANEVIGKIKILKSFNSYL